MRSNLELLKDLNTQFMKEEIKRLNKLQDQESMNPKKREHMDSQSERDLKKDQVIMYPDLENMNIY
jgi:hypothetical protein